nr:At1G65230-like protein [Tanacetum cinerariifolium]
MVWTMEFGELCNEFECISSPSVEATARQLVRDILELREGNRALGTYAVSVKYKSVQDMSMLSTSVLTIKWTLTGNPKNQLARLISGHHAVYILQSNLQKISMILSRTFQAVSRQRKKISKSIQISLAILQSSSKIRTAFKGMPTN